MKYSNAEHYTILVAVFLMGIGFCFKSKLTKTDFLIGLGVVVLANLWILLRNLGFYKNSFRSMISRVRRKSQ